LFILHPSTFILDSGGSAVQHLGDVGVVHHRQGLALGLEAGDDLPGIHPRLDDLERHFAAHRPGLLGDVDDAHAPLADLFQQRVRADDRPGAFGDRPRAVFDRRAERGSGQEAAGVLVGLQEQADLLDQR